MDRYYVFKDGQQVGSTSGRDLAIDLIRQYQAQETHPWLKAAFSIIRGTEEFIEYEKPRRN